MAERILLSGYVYKGVRYGPGKADLPDADSTDDPKESKSIKTFLDRVESREKDVKAELDERVQSAVGGSLPEGYTYSQGAAMPYIAPESHANADAQAPDESGPNAAAPRMNTGASSPAPASAPASASTDKPK